MTKKTKHVGRPQSAEPQHPDQAQGKTGQAMDQRGSDQPGEGGHAFAAPGSEQLPPAADFWRMRSVTEFALEQGVQLPQDVDQLIGQGAECWDSDADFERWMKWLAEIRLEGR